MGAKSYAVVVDRLAPADEAADMTPPLYVVRFVDTSRGTTHAEERSLSIRNTEE